MLGKVVEETPMRVPRVVLRSWKKDPVDSVSRSEEEIDEIVGDDSGGSNSTSWFSIFFFCFVYCLENQSIYGTF
ncbi:hypothetical protein CTI12_AA050620 [Artemisia annua]|uniref:Uncharacterized protein n=1 Tax=Artemisia annua TaxID=35608 RepID=A0A2U1QBR8_ARTAN|nr:hypothetical protein CTI12_AA050620 [Artemisia annua]